MTHSAERDVPAQYGVQIRVNSGRPSEYWAFQDDEWPLRDSVDGAQDDLTDALDYGYAAEDVRVVAINVIPPAEPDAAPDAEA